MKLTAEILRLLRKTNVYAIALAVNLLISFSLHRRPAKDSSRVQRTW